MTGRTRTLVASLALPVAAALSVPGAAWSSTESASFRVASYTFAAGTGGTESTMYASVATVGNVQPTGMQEGTTLAVFAGMVHPDSDSDGTPDSVDNCPGTANPTQTNTDFDAADAVPDPAGDACDAFPTNPAGWTDVDADGLGDEWEQKHFGNLTQGAGDNPDGDTLTNLEEFENAGGASDPTDENDPPGQVADLLGDDVVGDFGAGVGLWVWKATGAWQKLLDNPPASVVLADLDGNGQDDLVVTVSGSGLWVRVNEGAWLRINTLEPEDVLVSDVNGDDVEELVLDFGATGLWQYTYPSSWLKLNDLSPDVMATVDADGTGSEALALGFPGAGTYLYRSGASWERINTLVPASMFAADLDGDGSEDLILDFGATGLWVRKATGAWEKLLGDAPTSTTPADLDGNGQDDLVMTPDSGGLWVRLNEGAWQRINSLIPEQVLVADMDDDGAEDLVVDFGGPGLWVYGGGLWAKVNSLSPGSMAAADVDADGLVDLALDFGAGVGLWLRLDDASWLRLNIAPATNLQSGDLDGV